MLNTPVKYFRGPVSFAKSGPAPKIDREGGRYAAGLISDFAVITRGEALGHGVYCDREFLSSIVEQTEGDEMGRKSRYTHPDMSADGLSKGLGRANRLYLDGDSVRGDLHFFRSAHNSPDGNLAGYVMDRTEEDPQSLGASIVFSEDVDGTIDHALQHGAKWDGDSLDFSGFKSPDPDNVKNLPHVRLKKYRGVDIVDDPAANPSGMFSQRDQTFADAEKLFSFVVGEIETPPEISLDVNPERVASFVTRFLQSKGLAIMPTDNRPEPKPEAETESVAVETQETESQETQENQETETVENEQTTDETNGEESQDNEGSEGESVDAVETDSDDEETELGEPGRGELKTFMRLFGDAEGARWYAEGVSLDDAKDKFIALQADQIKQLEQEKRFAESTDSEGVSGGDAGDVGIEKKRTFADTIRLSK